MSPRKPVTKSPVAEAKVSRDGVEKPRPKRKYGKVRRLENGLLDVERKGGRYPKL